MQARNKIRGPLYSPIRLTIMRKGKDKPIELTIVRDIIRVPERPRLFGGGSCHICPAWGASQIDLQIDFGVVLFSQKKEAVREQRSSNNLRITDVFSLTGDYSATMEYDENGRDLTTFETMQASIKLFRDDYSGPSFEWRLPTPLQLTKISADDQIVQDQRRFFIESSNIVFQKDQPGNSVLTASGGDAEHWKPRGELGTNVEQLRLRLASVERRLEDSWAGYHISASAGKIGESYDLGQPWRDSAQAIFSNMFPKFAT